MTRRSLGPILLATGNRDKQAQFREILDGLPLSPVTPGEIGLSAAPDEDGDTHEAIARDKAMQWSSSSSMLAMASDGGLVIPALGPRWESRFTHRFAGPAADNGERLARLLELMHSYRGEERRASWVEALALADRGRVLVSWELSGGIGYLDEQPPAGPLPGVLGVQRLALSPIRSHLQPAHCRTARFHKRPLGPLAPAGPQVLSVHFCASGWRMTTQATAWRYIG